MRCQSETYYDADADRPIYAAVTAAKVNDITMAKQMPIEPGATYVFDLGYYDYAWWAELDAVGCRIVTRFKSNTPLDLIKELSVATGSNILSDRIGSRPHARPEAAATNADAVREVRVATESGRCCAFVERPRRQRREIADLYRRRWPSNFLPLGQTDPQDHPFRRHLRKRRAHPNRRRADRLPFAAAGSGPTESHPEPNRL